MLVASGVGAELDAAAVPVIDGVRDLLAAGMVAGGTERNHAFVSDSVDWGTLPEAEQLLLADAQTSGGLLLAVAPGSTDRLIDTLNTLGTPSAAKIGGVITGQPGQVTMR